RDQVLRQWVHDHIPVPVRSWLLFFDCLGQRAHLGACLSDADTWAQTSDAAQIPIVALLRGWRPATNRNSVGCNCDVNVRWLGFNRIVKPLWHDAENRE